jgi:hypothetical protein
MKPTTYTDEQRVQYDLFAGDEGEISCCTVKIRTAKKEHPCFGGAGSSQDGHTIKPGERYRHEKALIDGSFWGNYRLCLTCLDNLLTELGVEDDDD